MKFLHLSDLHFGKSIYGYSMMEHQDQPVWVNHFLEKVREIQPDAVVIAGDIYDRSNPSGEAMELFNYFLTELNRLQVPVLLIAGNHDSGQRIRFADQMLLKNQIYIAGVVEKEMNHVTLTGKDGDEVTFWLMPYLFPAIVSEKLENPQIKDYDDAVRALLAEQEIDFSKKNVLVAHQNVTAFGKKIGHGGSESMVGGVGQIDYSVFDGFDYVALGHIHAAYSVGRPEVRYAGSPLCYHFDETRQAKKGPILVTIGEKNGPYAAVETEVMEIPPLHPLRVIKGTYEDIRRSEENNPVEGEYVSVTVTDQKMTPEISLSLSELFETKNSFILERASSFEAQHAQTAVLSSGNAAEKSLQELFSDFYRFRNQGEDPSEAEVQALTFVQQLAEKNVGSITKEGITPSMEEEADQLIAYIAKTAGRMSQ